MGLRGLNYYLALVPSRGNRTARAWSPPKEVLCLHFYCGPQSKKPAPSHSPFPQFISLFLWLSLLCVVAVCFGFLVSTSGTQGPTPAIWPHPTYQAPFWIPVLARLRDFTCLGGGREMQLFMKDPFRCQHYMTKGNRLGSIKALPT